MTYDSSISTEVSLSNILDQMILDNTQIDIIAQFLESHESCVKDIFANSVFVYELYDVSESTQFPDVRLEKYIPCLHPIQMFFVLTSCVNLALEFDLPDDRKKYAHMLGRCPEAKAYLNQYCGIVDDRTRISNGIDFVEYLDDIISKSHEGYFNLEHFLSKSYFLASTLSHKVFLELNPVSQYTLMKKLITMLQWNTVDYLRAVHANTDKIEVLVYLLVTLMKQLLCSGHVDTFKHINGMLTRGSLKNIRKFIFDSLPSKIQNSISVEKLSFEEIVFEMNMWVNTFDTLDLFLYIYVCDERLEASMRQNSDLLEFFDLPFSYNCL